MTKLKNLIGHIFTKKNMKIFLILFVVVGFFVGCSFAQTQGTTTESTPVDKLSHLMYIIISMLSWGRVVLATLAGKLMTNDLVYGTFLNLDSSLWNLWNIMKNFANFTLGFILVFTIVKNLFTGSFGKESPIQGAKDTIIKTLLAGVLIQMSRFLIAVLIDLSTIGMAAVGALPSQFMAGSGDFRGQMQSLISNANTKLVIDFSQTGNIVDVLKTGANNNTPDDVNKLLDTILPSSNSMVGPFVFLGASVFNLYDLSDTSKNLSGESKWSDVLLSLGINGFVLIIFSLMLLLIFAFNLFRLITLWVVIPISPFIFMLSVFSMGGKSPIKLKDGFLKDVVDFKNILNLIFKPVYMTLILSIVLIVMVLVRTLVKANSGPLDLREHNNMTIESRNVGTEQEPFYESSLNVADIADISMEFKESIVDILVYILCLILMVMLVKSCMSGKITGIGFIDKKIEGLSKLMWGGSGEFGGLLGNAPIIPMGKDEHGYAQKVGIGSVIDYAKKGREEIDRAIDDRIRKQDQAISDAFGLNDNYGSFSDLKNETTRDSWIKKAAKICIDRGWDSASVAETRDKSFRPALDDILSKIKYSQQTISYDDINTEIKKQKEEMKSAESGDNQQSTE